ncbi:MAG TPA: hypothetical protein VIK24_00250, partial [Pyrinomonadaceae bacterium]
PGERKTFMSRIPTATSSPSAATLRPTNQRSHATLLTVGSLLEYRSFEPLSKARSQIDPFTVSS